jgi:hypothetical protein
MYDSEEAVRQLFTAATEDIPPGIDLLGRVRARSKARVIRIRALVATGAAGIVAAGAAITLSTVQAPSAFAQVMHAAARTAAESYQVSSTSTMVKVPGLGTIPSSPAITTGEFDPARGVGEETSSRGIQVRYVDGSIYLPLTGAYRAVYDQTHGAPIPADRSWLRLPMPLQAGKYATAVELLQLGTIAMGLEPVDPQGLLAVLQSASQVREVGPASGPGWTGTAYTFTATMTLPGSPQTILSTSGTVDVDQQGRIRQLDAVQSIGPIERKLEVSFGDFGIPVSVSAPPASQTFTPPPGNVSISISSNGSASAAPPTAGGSAGG